MSAPTYDVRRLDLVGKLRRTCDVCGAPISHPPRAGRPRRFCASPLCQRLGRNATRREHYAHQKGEA